jgi:hypothetical protein
MNPKLLQRLLAHLRETDFPVADVKAVETETVAMTERNSRLHQFARRRLIDERLHAELKGLGVDLGVGGLPEVAAQLFDREFEVTFFDTKTGDIDVLVEKKGTKQTLDVAAAAKQLFGQHELLRRHVNPEKVRDRERSELGDAWDKPPPPKARGKARTYSKDELEDMDAGDLLRRGWDQDPGSDRSLGDKPDPKTGR